MARDKWAYLASRRTFCWTVVGVVVAPGIAIAQTSKGIRRIGLLHNSAPVRYEELRGQADLFREHGWIEGQNLQVERRYDNGRPETLRALAEELVRAQVEIIVTWGTPATLAAKHATNTIPIIFGSAGDPVLLGLVASLARPGGNVTGFSTAGPELDAKQLSLLKEMLPGLQRVAFLWQVGNTYYNAARGQVEHTCRLLGLDAVFAEYAVPGEIGVAIALAARKRAQALVVSMDDFVPDHAVEIFDTATKHGLPSMADFPRLAKAGALLTYAYSNIESYRVLFEYIDRVLRGAKPADLPVQQPTQFTLVINLKTAQALGLTVPKEMLIRADEVIR